MNAKLIVDQATLHKAMPIEFIYGKRYINEAMNVLASRYDDACIQDSVDIVCTDVTADYEMPANDFGVLEVIDDSGRRYTDYRTHLGRIAFAREGTYKVVYLRGAAEIVNEASEPEIHQIYHYPIAYYVASVDLNRIRPGDPKAQELMVRFFNDAEAAHIRLQRPRRRGIVMSAPIWR